MFVAMFGTNQSHSVLVKAQPNRDATVPADFEINCEVKR